MHDQIALADYWNASQQGVYADCKRYLALPATAFRTQGALFAVEFGSRPAVSMQEIRVYVDSDENWPQNDVPLKDRRSAFRRPMTMFQAAPGASAAAVGGRASGSTKAFQELQDIVARLAANGDDGADQRFRDEAVSWNHAFHENTKGFFAWARKARVAAKMAFLALPIVPLAFGLLKPAIPFLLSWADPSSQPLWGGIVVGGVTVSFAVVAAVQAMLFQKTRGQRADIHRRHSIDQSTKLAAAYASRRKDWVMLLKDVIAEATNAEAAYFDPADSKRSSEMQRRWLEMARRIRMQTDGLEDWQCANAFLNTTLFRGAYCEGRYRDCYMGEPWSFFGSVSRRWMSRVVRMISLALAGVAFWKLGLPAYLAGGAMDIGRQWLLECFGFATLAFVTQWIGLHQLHGSPDSINWDFAKEEVEAAVKDDARQDVETLYDGLIQNLTYLTEHWRRRYDGYPRR